MMVAFDGSNGIFCAVNGLVRYISHQFGKGPAVIDFTVVGDYIVDFVKIDFFFQVFNEFFGKRRPNRIDQNGLFVTN
jgi:hypothetical protein